MFLEWIFWGGLGLIIGSFVNVLILRHGEEGVGGRSFCPACRRSLQWFELVPVLSWVLLRGKCRTCHARISIQYPLVELLTAAGFLIVGLAPVSLPLQALGAGMIALLIAISVYDLYHTIIPDRWVYSFGVLALLSMFFDGWSLLSIAAGPLVALPLFLLWLVSKGEWMGLGDAKLALGIGWLLGVAGGYIALGLSFMLGALIGVGVLLPLPHLLRVLAHAGITRRHLDAAYTMKSEVPFGPFLVCSTTLVWIAQLYELALVPALVAFLSLS